MTKHAFVVDRVKLGRRGQVTIPKQIREEDGLRERDVLVVTHLPGGQIMLEKVTAQTPEDLMLEAIARAPAFDARAAWKEVEAERARERA